MLLRTAATTSATPAAATTAAAAATATATATATAATTTTTTATTTSILLFATLLGVNAPKCLWIPNHARCTPSTLPTTILQHSTRIAI